MSEKNKSRMEVKRRRLIGEKKRMKKARFRGAELLLLTTFFVADNYEVKQG